MIERRGQDVIVRPAGALHGVVELPGSKSLTNRCLICAALADGVTTLRQPATADDAARMVTCLRQLGIEIVGGDQAHALEVRGCGGHLPAGEVQLDVGPAGTVARFLPALLALGHGRFRVDGSPRMRERPIGPLVDALRGLGASIEYEDTEGCLPIVVHARGLAGGEYSFAAPPSSQFVSALLMAAPYAARDVYLAIEGPVVSEPYIDMTLAVMRSLGVEALAAEGRRFIVPSSQRYRGGDVRIEPDASGASYFWGAAAVTGGRVRVNGLSRSSLQGDVAFVDVLAGMGCGIEAGPDFIEVAGPPPGELRGVDVDLNRMPDVVQTLAVVALFAKGGTHIRNVANLRLKETDRLAALREQLTRLGATVRLEADGIMIEPPQRMRPAEVDTYDDHRMAMSFALAGLGGAEVRIRGAGCVSKSFPDYFERLASLGL